MGHTCAARILVFSSFLPSFPSPPLPSPPSCDVVDLAAQPATIGQVELSRTARQSGIRDLHLSRCRPCTTCRGHLALCSLIATGNSTIACARSKGSAGLK
jgi:hypothetical protein